MNQRHKLFDFTNLVDIAMDYSSATSSTKVLPICMPSIYSCLGLYNLFSVICYLLTSKQFHFDYIALNK